MIDLVRRVIAVYDKIPLLVLTLLARIMIGLVFFRSGLTKIDGIALRDATFFLFENEYHVPLLPPVFAAYLATATELTMPILIWLGLGTRFAATALLGMTLVIQTFVYPDAYMTHGFWAIALLVLMKFGAGTVSVDHLLKRQYVGLEREEAD